MTFCWNCSVALFFFGAHAVLLTYYVIGINRHRIGIGYWSVNNYTDIQKSVCADWPWSSWPCSSDFSLADSDTNSACAGLNTAELWPACSLAVGSSDISCSIETCSIQQSIAAINVTPVLAMLFYYFHARPRDFYRAIAYNATHGIAKAFLSVCLSVCPSICPSVCQTRALWQNKINLCPRFYTIWKNVYPSFRYE